MLVDINACLILENGSHFFGTGIGMQGITTGDVCFNTAMTGYQEVLSDPSYAGQIITFAFPHIGNVGVNDHDTEAKNCFLKGIIIKDNISAPSNYRSKGHLNNWLIEKNITGISQVDTRTIIKNIRSCGPLKGLIYYGNSPPTLKDLASLQSILDKEQGIENRDLSLEVAIKDIHFWKNKDSTEYSNEQREKKHVVVIDCGVKMGIIRALERRGCMITILPPHTTYADIIRLNPKGIILSNGPGDPRPIARYITPIIRQLLKTGIPIFGICLGHQLLGLAIGATIRKMITGHHGVNHPVKNLENGKIEITSQNHEFTLEAGSLPKECIVTHISQFDGTLQGIALQNKPVFSVQFHPEASPGPHDSFGLFEKFLSMVMHYAKTN